MSEKIKEQGSSGHTPSISKNAFMYYLDISKPEQKQRLNERKNDPLTQWKVSAFDDQALKKWKQYSLARDVMLATPTTP